MTQQEYLPMFLDGKERPEVRIKALKDHTTKLSDVERWSQIKKYGRDLLMSPALGWIVDDLRLCWPNTLNNPAADDQAIATDMLVVSASNFGTHRFKFD
jgi:hypothetical protein